MNKKKFILFCASVQKYGSNLVSNPGFETAGAGGADVFANWEEDAGNGALADGSGVGEYHSGAHALKLTSGASSNGYCGINITVPANKRIRIQMYVRGDGSNSGRWWIWNNSAGATFIDVTDTLVVGTTYTLTEQIATVPVGTTSLYLYLKSPPTVGGVCYFDDISICELL